MSGFFSGLFGYFNEPQQNKEETDDISITEEGQEETDNIIIKDNIEPENIDFDSYLPVFLYSHAEFATIQELDDYGTQSIFSDPYNRGKIKKIVKKNELFMDVPDNVIVVDPIMKGNLCLSYKEIDYGFPNFVSEKGNNAFINNEKYNEAIKSINNEKYNEAIKSINNEKLTHIINTFYNNKKVYFPGSTINNFSIIFDVNKKGSEYDIPWNIRYKKTETGTLDTLGLLSRQYNLGRENEVSKRIMLKDVIKMIKEQINSDRNIPEKYKNNKDVKIMLYLVSCRGGDTELHEDKEIYEAQQKVYNNGLYKITDRKARSTGDIFEKPKYDNEYDSENEYDDQSKEMKKRKLDRKQDVEIIKKQKKGGGRKTKKAKKNKKKKTKSVKKRAKNKTRKIKKRKSVKKRAKKY